MLKTFERFSHLHERVLGVDLDGVLNNFAEGFNDIYLKCFPGRKVVPVNKIDDWYWYHSLEYNGQEPYEWMENHRYEMWKISKPYPGAVYAMKEIFKYTQDNGIMLRIVTCQPGQDAPRGAIDWLSKYGIRYDDIAFVPRSVDKWDQADVQVDDSPYVIRRKPHDKVSIKIIQKWNLSDDADFEISDIALLSPELVEEAFKKLYEINR